MRGLNERNPPYTIAKSAIIYIAIVNARRKKNTGGGYDFTVGKSIKKTYIQCGIYTEVLCAVA